MPPQQQQPMRPPHGPPPMMGAPPPPGALFPNPMGPPPPHLQQQPQFQPPRPQQRPHPGMQHQLQHPPPQHGPPFSQPPHRGMRPPFGSGPPLINSSMAPPTLHAGPMAGLPPNKSQGISSAAAGSAVVGGALPDKLNTLFIGSIAPGINNTTGSLVKWKRVQDPTTQQWKAFGFAEYADADSLLRTLRVLGQDGQQPKGEKSVGLELTAMDGSGVTKNLLVKADDKTRQFLDQYEESRPRTIHDTEKDKVSLANATKIIQQIKDGTLDVSEPQPGQDDKDSKESNSKSKSDSEPKPSSDASADGAELTEEQKEHIARELNFFRERAVLKEKEKKEEEERARRSSRSSHDHKQHRDRDSEGSSGSHRTGRGRAMDFVPASGANHIELASSSSSAGTHGPSGASSSNHQDAAIDSEEEEKSRQERKEKELEQAYKDRERRWEQRESERLRLYERDKARDEDYDAELKSMKESMAHRFAHWDDDVERERRHEDYYRDRSRWWQRRQAFLQKEERYDDLDREEEKEELAREAVAAAAAAAAAKKAQEESATANSADQEAATESEDVIMSEPTATDGGATEETPDTSSDATSTPLPVESPSAAMAVEAEVASSPTPPVDTTVLPKQATKLKLSLAPSGLKRGTDSTNAPTLSSTAGSTFLSNEFEGDDEDDKEVKRRRVLVPLEFSDDEGEADSPGDAMTASKEAKEKQIKELIQSIPADAQGLWNWSIQWQYVEEENHRMLKEKIQPFAGKKVVELLGVQEDDLTNFVVKHIKDKKPPQDLVAELRGALDNEADVLVMKIWRMLIFETESKARKLGP
ncbi:hypothetical protein BGW38_003655 [Lunasporangiospora selenospora]|uniref:PWI domain-containing protein n=1 Tax=Lunasporangiospora selenospora TaxID=979761 RepID=A0A9P6FQB5_9FUNG|nr:hypothetical protein BGW38_003655 [Lunasporangiospora selenospora]